MNHVEKKKKKIQNNYNLKKKVLQTLNYVPALN